MIVTLNTIILHVYTLTNYSNCSLYTQHVHAISYHYVLDCDDKFCSTI